jgi:hydroxymethylpyrimidine kinase/phosphomethylpyrimidine kinase
MVSTSGSQLLPPDAVSILRDELLPMTTIITPNIPEAKLLLGKKDSPNPNTEDDMVQLAKDLHKLGSQYVLVKGGHFFSISRDNDEDRQIVDVLYDGEHAHLIKKTYIKVKNTHGTGCSLACKY